MSLLIAGKPLQQCDDIVVCSQVDRLQTGGQHRSEVQCRGLSLFGVFRESMCVRLPFAFADYSMNHESMNH